ncbi:hypothetical protein BH10BDE1_BH10BDE1_31430 [soil metagenome]
MTPKCPKCSTELRDEYGMVTCPSCGAIVFVDMEGAAHVASDQPASVEPPDLHAAEPASGYAPTNEKDSGGVDLFAPLPSFGGESSGLESPMIPEPMTPEPMSAEPFAAPEPFAQEPAEDAPEMDMNAFLGYEPDPAQVAAAEAKAAAKAAATASQNDPNDPLGLSAYANSEMSGAKNGPLVVSIIISGIDAKDLRDEIRQALQDSRFGWDTAALMSGIKGGTLRIDRVSPVKATILINRIKNLSVRIRWEQSAITEIDPTEKDL